MKNSIVQTDWWSEIQRCWSQKESTKSCEKTSSTPPQKNKTSRNQKHPVTPVEIEALAIEKARSGDKTARTFLWRYTLFTIVQPNFWEGIYIPPRKPQGIYIPPRKSQTIDDIVAPETTDSETSDSETTDSETTDSETTDSETTGSETTGESFTPRRSGVDVNEKPIFLSQIIKQTWAKVKQECQESKIPETHIEEDERSTQTRKQQKKEKNEFKQEKELFRISDGMISERSLDVLGEYCASFPEPFDKLNEYATSLYEDLLKDKFDLKRGVSIRYYMERFLLKRWRKDLLYLIKGECDPSKPKKKSDKSERDPLEIQVRMNELRDSLFIYSKDSSNSQNVEKRNITCDLAFAFYNDFMQLKKDLGLIR